MKWYFQGTDMFGEYVDDNAYYSKILALAIALWLDKVGWE